MISWKHPCKLSFRITKCRCAVSSFCVLEKCFTQRERAVPVPASGRPVPHPFPEPIRTSELVPCSTPAKDLFALLANRRSAAGKRWPCGQESFYRRRLELPGISSFRRRRFSTPAKPKNRLLVGRRLRQSKTVPGL